MLLMQAALARFVTSFTSSKCIVLAPTYSCELKSSLPSALEGFTAVFGMGTGVSLPLEAPGLCTQRKNDV